MRHYLFYIYLFIQLISPVAVIAATVPAGVPDHALWFSKDPFFEGDSITIYALLYNSGANQLSGVLALFDGTSTLATKSFTIESGGASTVVAFPWKVTGGAHTFSAAITSNAFTTKNKSKTDDAVATLRTGEVKRFADRYVEKSVSTTTLPKAAVVATEALPTAVTDRLPEPILDSAIPVIGALESYRVKSYGKEALAVEKIVNDLGKSLATSTATSGASTAGGWGVFKEGALSPNMIHSPLGYAMLFFHLVWQSILGNTYVFYSFLIFAVLFVLRVIWGILF